MRTAARLCVLAACLGAGCHDSAPTSAPADLVLRGGRIVTVDPAKPEAEALAVSGDQIVAVGTIQEIEPYIGAETQVIDLDGKLATPGLIEGHGHFMGIGDAQLQLRLMGTRNWSEIVTMVSEAVEESEPGEWIRGRGWHQEKWDLPPTPSVEGFPTHHSLSQISPENPVVLRHASGHASFANAKAMELAEVTADTPDPPGGEILRDGDGNPIGVFRETAQRLIAPSSDSDRALDRRRAELATKECLSKGITSFQDAGSSFETIDLFKELAEKGELGLRLWVMVRGSNEELAEKLASYRMLNVADHRLTVRAIKRGIDGALGPRGAWLLEPYSDHPESTGFNTSTVEDIEETARLAIEHGFQLCVHAIGDRANRETLDLFERTFQANPDLPGEDLRWRVEHAQHLHLDDIPRFAELGVIASMQGIHCVSDAPWAQTRLGEKRNQEGSYVWQSLLRSGAIVTNGTDAPVEDVDPIASFYATVSRRLGDGSVFYADQRMSREEALRSYTLNAAYAAFEDDIKGSLSPGKLADITVLSKDILTIPEDEIPTTEVLFTIVGGKVMFRKAPATTILSPVKRKGGRQMFRNPLLLTALLILGFALNSRRPARAQVISLKEAVNLPKPPPDHRIPYGEHTNQFGDLRLPEGDGPFPVVIAIHGGCYQAKYDLTLLSSFCADLTAAGVATWSLEYRRVGNEGGGWPGTFQDIARGSDYLRVVAQSYPIDLGRVVAVGHSAGGHFVAWLAARSRLPKKGVLYSENPIALLGVVSLAGVMDSRADLEGGVCKNITPQLLGGLPSEVPDHYAQVSAIELLPIGIPIRSIIGDQDGAVLIDMVKRYDENARAAGDDSTLSIVEGAGHFELTTPGSFAWGLVKETVLSLFEPK